MRWSDVHDGLAELRAQPHVAVPALLTGLWLLAMPVYLASVYYAFALDYPDLFLVDYSFFHYAAERFAANPLALYEDPEYLYPPPAVLAFLPATLVSGPVGYVALGPILFVGLGVAFAWALRLWEREASGSESASDARVFGTPTRVALLVIALGSGPTFQNLRYAQVNVLMLLAALAFLHLVQRGKPGWGALALTGGFWLKLLPLALLPLGLWSKWPRLALGALVGLVAVPLALLPVLPLELYREYLFERLPAFSGATDLGSMSNSIQASVTRWAFPMEIGRAHV